MSVPRSNERIGIVDNIIFRAYHSRLFTVFSLIGIVGHFVVFSFFFFKIIAHHFDRTEPSFSMALATSTAKPIISTT